MRAMNIQVNTGLSGWTQMKAAWNKNRIHYLQEALGLSIFMASACYFGAMLFSPESSWYSVIKNELIRNGLMGVSMGITALFIFYSPLTSPSGAQINPAVSIAFLRIGRMCRYDTLFFILFQMAGGTITVIIMQRLMGKLLTSAPVCSVVTIPGKYGTAVAALTELVIAFITMMMVLFTSHHRVLKNYTRIFAACLVCTWVILAGPLSGFGMNPARSFASALPAQIWTAFWIYLLMPLAGMLAAAEVFLKTSSVKQQTV
ncbi:MAG: aquaporin [Chitinophagaceae bacterium]|nr:aquaporin [Chitinophagaceae bacterium]